MSHQILHLPGGTRIDFGEGSYEYPLSLDLKITGYCLRGCPWCHENSGPSGKHGDAEMILKKLQGLPRGTEIAIGGGNPLSHPDLPKIVRGLKDMGYTVNMTIQESDLGEAEIPEELTALGLSIAPGFKSPKSSLPSIPTVAHLILGINGPNDYREVKKYFPRVLWLGFKRWGRNKNSDLPELSEIRREIVRDLYQGRNLTLAFDNLALEQLNLKASLLKSEWERFYLGPEFTSSMYVDGVKGEYSGYSTSPDRVSWKNLELQEYYVKNSRKY